jgi:hypothetical protein
MHVSSNFGFGQNIGDLDLDDAVDAVYWEMIGGSCFLMVLRNKL